MGKKKKGGNKPTMAVKTPGIKPNNPNISNVKNMAAASRKKGMTAQQNKMVAAVQNINAPYVQLPGTNIYVPRSGGYVHPSQMMHPTWASNQWPDTNMYTNQLPMQSQYTYVNTGQFPQQSQYKIKPKKKKQKQPPGINVQKPGKNINKNQQPGPSQSKVTPNNKTQMTASNIQKPGTNISTNQQPGPSQSKVTPNNKTQPTASNIQKPGTNINTNQQPGPSQSKVTPNNKTQPTASNIQKPGTNINTNQQPGPSQSKVTPNNKTQQTASNLQKPGININTNQLPVQSQSTNVNKKQVPQQSQNKINPQNKKQNQPAASNIQRPGPNINTKQLPGPSQYKAYPKKKKKKKPKKPAASNIQRPGTNVNTNQQPVQSQSKVTPNNKTQPTASNFQKPGTNLNTNQLPVQSQSKVTPNNKTQQQTGINIQKPGTNVNNKQQPAQSNCKATPDKKMQPTGTNIQQQASKSAATPGLQTQDSPATVTSTSGGTGSMAPKVEEVDLTDDIIEIPYVKEIIEVDLTMDEIEMESMNEVTEVDSTNAACLLTAQPNILSDSSPDIWHKVTVNSAVVDRVAVLNAINKQISPEKLDPYFFKMEDGHITFLVNNCSASLAALFKHNLKVPFSSTKIELKVQLHAKKVSLSAILHKVVGERLSFERSFLDLSDLSSIPEIEELLYHPSVTSHLECELLKTAQLMAPDLIGLSIAGNKMSALRHLSNFFTDLVKWRTLKKLDISNNKIDSFSELGFFKSLRITELNLHMNPLCGKYKEDAYVRVVKVNFPHILKLDGMYLQCLPSLPRWRPNYIFSSNHGDSFELADQFVEHFFTLYDHEERLCLWDLYHEYAYFSISCTYFHGQTTSHNARLSAYIAECRNLLHPSYKLRSETALSRGRKKILERFDELPRTQHDRYSFTVDLLHHSEKSAILTVTGVFRERDVKLPTSPRHFMRSFVLIRLQNNEYRIVNDIMYVTNASTEQATESFLYIHPPESTPKKVTQLAEGEKNAMVARYSNLTNMKAEWSRKCLITADWNLRTALKTFIKLYEAGKFPEFRFIKSPKKK